ncbi:PHD finger protein [Apostasia shenzhenica]|uniref:PHD finger protein n=1 Tax=Apostasia shenzhenica TaxID=1088818 RepID=A0A2I0AC14_9ASPA|nr:PHD finger protein [Apostasia shenzhenica]
MKGRSHSLPSTAPLEDWGDGQWTVDCSCGVTFDDGEEMVSCDECGVWVHTRCSGFIRGEASFACYKCKAGGGRSRFLVSSSAAAADGGGHDSEETEVAQLLVELPMKAADLCPPPIPAAGFRLWAHLPKEERVHVHGVPGGDPSLFEGLSSSIFSRDLWKCTGYVPKKFNFKYKEFPCWEEDEGDTASRGADVLFSLSKETGPVASVRTLDRMLNPDGSGRKVADKKASIGSVTFASVKKERNKIRVIGSQLGKRRKDETGDLKEISWKKKAKEDLAGSVPLFNSSKDNLGDYGSLKIPEPHLQVLKCGHKNEDVLLSPNTNNHSEGLENGCKPKNMLVLKTFRRGMSHKPLRSTHSLETPLKVEKDDRLDSGVSSKLGPSAACYPLHDKGTKASIGFVKQEDVSQLAHGLNEKKDGSHVEQDRNGGSSAVVVDLPKAVVSLDSRCSQLVVPDMDSILCSDSHSSAIKKIEKDVKVEVNDQTTENSNFLFSFDEGKQSGSDVLPHHQTKSMGSLSIIVPKSEAFNLDLSSNSPDCNKTAEGQPNLPGEVMASTGSVQKGSFESNHISEISSEAPMKLESASSNKSTPNVQKAVGFGKAIHPAKQQKLKVAASASEERDTTVSAKVSRQEGPCHPERGHSRVSNSSGPKSSHADRRIIRSFNSNHSSVNSKEQLSVSSSKVSTEIPSTSSATKFRSHSLAMQGSTSTNAVSMLSDEELALLLHQELNSSPRVPRVPRMRQATGMLSVTPSATSMLSKRSYSGCRDEVTLRLICPSLLDRQGFKKKNKEDSMKHSSRSDREGVSESRRVARTSESTANSDGFAKRDAKNRSPDTPNPSKPYVPGYSTEGMNGCAPSFEENSRASTSVQSPQTNVDVEGPTSRTLPGLINEIMNQGKSLTYEELCDAVRPHWHNLRKPNGDRYAYSSHFQAVLDCLRNRCEWAHLVDRVPKTNASKRRRKTDSDSPAAESEHEEVKSTGSLDLGDKNVGSSHREDFPKRKRNARKRRRPELRGRSSEKARKTGRYGGAISDDDYTACSHSSNEGTCHLSDEAGPETYTSCSEDTD